MLCDVRRIVVFVMVMGVCGIAVADRDRQLILVSTAEDAATLRIFDGTEASTVKAIMSALTERKITNQKISVEPWSQLVERPLEKTDKPRITILMSDEFARDKVAYLSASANTDVATTMAIASQLTEFGFKVRFLSEESFRIFVQSTIASAGGQSQPSSYYLQDDVQYFPTPPEDKLPSPKKDQR